MKKQKILIIEDEPAIALNIEKMLEMKGYEVCDVGTSANEAEKLTEKHKPDLILMDIILDRDKDGVTAVEDIMVKYDIPVLYITAHSDKKTIQRAKKTEPHGYILKPINEEELFLTIEIALYKHEMERKLKESESKYRKITKHATDIIWEMDLEGNFTFASPYANHILGYDFEESLEITPMRIEDILTPESCKIAVETIAKRLAIVKKNSKRGKQRNKGAELDESKYVVLELEHKRKDGSTFPAEISTRFVYNEDGKPVGISGITRDITERRKAEQELRDSEVQCRTLTQTANDAVLCLGDDGKVTLWNEAASRMFGYSAEEVLGKDLHTLIAPERFWKDAYKGLGHFFKTGKGKLIGETIEITARRKDGSEFPIELSISSMEIKGKWSATGIIRDITKSRKEKDELIFAKETADQANRAKSEFLANMSHELRTPLNAILGFSQLLEKNTIISENMKLKKYINFIRDNGNHLLEMVNDILDLSKIEAGKVGIDKKPFNFEEMISRLPSTIKSIAGNKNLQMKINITPGIGWLNGDELRLKQVIFNIMSNAIKFTDNERQIGVDAIADEDSIFVTIWDEGIGIPEKDIERIFNPFEQLKLNRANTGGTGLGLAISRNIIELHGGSITVKSEPGKGSSFTIALPGRIAVNDSGTIKKTDTETVEELTRNTRGKILVVEDNEINMMLIKEILDPLYDVDYVDTGEEAVKLVSDKSFHLILMDIQLPEMDGVETLKRIHEQRKEKVPAIALTAFAMKGDEEKYLDEGFNDYISKPLDLDMLLEKIKKQLSNEFTKM